MGREQAAAGRLIVRLDEDSKNVLTRAAGLRRVSVSDYVRQVAVSQASRDVAASEQRTISMTAEEQLAAWTALQEPVKLTPAQRRLGKVMRGEA